MTLSPLNHTWILDMDGTIVKHNGYKLDGEDSFLPGAREFLDSIPEDDMIVILTSRTDNVRGLTLEFLEKNAVRYDEIVFNAPYGERVVVNDKKPSGLDTAVAVNISRDAGDFPEIVIDEKL